jgi:DNA-binding Lrp family transcriptional regulator
VIARALEDGIPIVPAPFGALADRLGLRIETALSIAEDLLASGLLRRFGAFWDFRAVGYEGYLFGAMVPEDGLGAFARRVNECGAVTHNYERLHAVNLWFTAILPGDSASSKLAEELGARNFPFVALGAPRRIKLRPSFAGGPGIPDPCRQSGELSRPASPTIREISSLERKIISELQSPLHIEERPFAQAARRIEISEESFVSELVKLKSSGFLRRIGASVNHNMAGFTANTLMAWDFTSVPDEETAQTALAAVREREWASHCYLRRVVASNLAEPWPYNLFVMAHATDGNELSARERLLESELAPRAFVSMRTIREYKKTAYRFNINQGE